MPNRSIQQKIKMGYGLFINLTGNKGAAAWERAGFLFNSAREAAEYREAHYPTLTKWRVQAIRISAAKITDKDALSDSGNLVEKRSA